MRETAQIEVNLGGDGEQELPSHDMLIQHTPPQATMKARMDQASLQQFGMSQGDRSELGLSNASSIGLPGIGTLRAGINLQGQAQMNQSRQVAE